MQDNIEEDPKPNVDQVFTNIQNEPIMTTELVVLITKPTIAATKSFQPIQPIVEPIQMEKPTIF
jgi:hypothetical protein